MKWPVERWISRGMARLSAPFAAAVSLALSTACGETAGPARGEPELVAALDINADPEVIEIDLEAGLAEKRYRPGPATAVWTYNGTIPGPVIQARVGETLRVHFKNSLPEATTIHWHGLRLPAAMDGTLAMQAPILPDGTFEYEFRARDAGLFWFHPHVRSDVQVEKGLYGLVRITGPDEPPVDRERILVLDDVRVLDDGTLPTYLDDESKMLGRQGNVLLVNGESQPAFSWRAGSLERLLIVNVANGRFFNLALPGYSWRVMGTDGGFLPEPYDTEHLLIAPGERYDVALIPRGAPGDEVTLINDPYERGHDTGLEPSLPVASFHVSEESPLQGRSLPAAFPELERLPDGPTDIALLLDEGLVAGEIAFTINGNTYPDVPPFTVPAGELRRIEVRNESPMDHPFHLHGTFFQVLQDGTGSSPGTGLADKDTIIVPQRSSVRLVAPFDEPGRWMYHCHIFEHAEGGMMGEITVNSPN